MAKEDGAKYLQSLIAPVRESEARRFGGAMQSLVPYRKAWSEAEKLDEFSFK